MGSALIDVMACYIIECIQLKKNFIDCEEIVAKMASKEKCALVINKERQNQ